MAIAAPSNEVIRLVEALGLRTKNTREVTLRMAVNEAVAVNTVEYVNGEQIDALAAELKERQYQYRLTRWIPVEERLPDDETELLVAFEDRSLGVAFAVFHHIDENDGPTWTDGNGVELKQPTHWMPLPEPPEVT